MTAEAIEKKVEELKRKMREQLTLNSELQARKVQEGVEAMQREGHLAAQVVALVREVDELRDELKMHL